MSDPGRNVRAMRNWSERRRDVIAKVIAKVIAAVIVSYVVVAVLAGWAFALVGVGLSGAVFLLVHKARSGIDAAARREATLRAHAEQQHRWTLRGDSRGIYGSDGAELMRSVGLALSVPPKAEPPDDEQWARVAETPAELQTLLAEKPLCWSWALFASVLVQRYAAVQPRLRQHRLRCAAPTGTRPESGIALASRLVDRLEHNLRVIDQLETLMRSPGFVGMFGDRADGSNADADTIVRAAEAMMDYHDQLLGLAEDVQRIPVGHEHTEFLRDCVQFMDMPLEAYRRFIDDMVERVIELPGLLRWGPVPVRPDPVQWEVDGDDPILAKVFTQLREIREQAEAESVHASPLHRGLRAGRYAHRR